MRKHITTIQSSLTSSGHRPDVIIMIRISTSINNFMVRIILLTNETGSRERVYVFASDEKFAHVQAQTLGGVKHYINNKGIIEI